MTTCTGVADVNNPTLDDEAYNYDPVGNRLTASGVSGDITHNANNELRLYGDVAYDYDANGNMVSKTSAAETRQYVYNVQNRLVRVEDGSGSVIAEYGYDPFGRRLWKEVDGIRTYFFYADEGLVTEYDSSGHELRSYGYRPDSIWTTDPLWLKEDGEYYWYQNDHLGMPQKLIDRNGNLGWDAQYTAFGDAQIQVETVTNNLRFPGQYYDAETGLHYNYQRYYDPQTGRYTQVDPIGFMGGDENLYAYVWNNPVNLGDSQGLTTLVDLLIISGGGFVATALYCEISGACPEPPSVDMIRDWLKPRPIQRPDYVVPAPTPGPITPNIGDILPIEFPQLVPPAMPLPTPETCDMTYPPNRRPPSTPPGPDAIPPTSTPYVPWQMRPVEPTPPPPKECDLWEASLRIKYRQLHSKKELVLWWGEVTLYTLACGPFNVTDPKM